MHPYTHYSLLASVKNIRYSLLLLSFRSAMPGALGRSSSDSSIARAGRILKAKVYHAPRRLLVYLRLSFAQVDYSERVHMPRREKKRRLGNDHAGGSDWRPQSFVSSRLKFLAGSPAMSGVFLDSRCRPGAGPDETCESHVPCSEPDSRFQSRATGLVDARQIAFPVESDL